MLQVCFEAYKPYQLTSSPVPETGSYRFCLTQPHKFGIADGLKAWIAAARTAQTGGFRVQGSRCSLKHGAHGDFGVKVLRCQVCCLGFEVSYAEQHCNTLFYSFKAVIASSTPDPKPLNLKLNVQAATEALNIFS